MSLQVWLPLTKDLRQQGLLQTPALSLNAFTQESGGKLGQYCYTDRGIIHFTEDFLANQWSLACWVKSTSWSANNDIILCKNASESTNSQFYLSIINGTSFNLGINGGSSNGAGGYSYTFSTNTWYHVAATYNGTNYAMYINGNQVKSGTCTTTKPTGLLNLGIGCRSTNAGGTASTGNVNKRLNDVRIYNHCLSPMEVKELAKGLVLHYPLNRQGWGQENLATCTTPQYNLSASTGNYNYFWIASAGTLTAGKTYTVSAEVTVSDNIERCTIYNYHTNPTTGGPQYNYFPADGKRHSWTFTASATGLLGYCGVAGATANHTAVYKNIKIEEGEIATPYIPRSNETLYTTMGLNSTTEYDCSGFCNNGSKMTDTITYNSDTAKYAVSTHFNGTYDGIIIENLALKDMINSAITYAFWIKPESESGARSIYFGSYSSISWSVEKTAGNQLRLYWNGSPDETCSGAIITDGVWQHVCITKSGTNDVKVYINGVQKWTSTATHSSLNFPTTYRIGRDTRSNDGTPYKGLMSDFRIYATALSADDVKSLYQNSAYIDSSGNVYGAVHTEV